MKKNYTHASGFTLVEIAIVLTIIGVLLGSGVLALTGALNDIRYRTTRDRMNGIANAIALYAQHNMSIPCPANPPDAQGRTDGITTGFSCGGAGSRGIVPYTTLGLTAEQAQDAYGQFISYTINTNLTSPSSTSVLRECRIANIWVASGLNRNPRKARFCCFGGGSLATDLAVWDQPSGGTRVSPERVISSGASAPENTAFTPDSTYVPDNGQTPAFVLVSHGRNFLGAYRPASTKTRYADPAATYRPFEAENDNDDRVFVSATYSTNRNNGRYFDDIVVWRTQDQLLSAFGRDSCARP